MRHPPFFSRGGILCLIYLCFFFLLLFFSFLFQTLRFKRIPSFHLIYNPLFAITWFHAASCMSEGLNLVFTLYYDNYIIIIIFYLKLTNT